jgi:hypothetical protein
VKFTQLSASIAADTGVWWAYVFVGVVVVLVGLDGGVRARESPPQKSPNKSNQQQTNFTTLIQ